MFAKSVKTNIRILKKLLDPYIKTINEMEKLVIENENTLAFRNV